MLVTEIRQIDTKKYCLYINDAPFSIVYASDIKRMQLEEGREISDERLEAFRKEYLPRRAMNRALSALQYSEQCEADIRKKLENAWYAPDIIDDTVDKLKTYGYLDDGRYVCGFIRNNLMKKSRKQIRYQLLSKGISLSVIEKAFEELDLPDEYEGLKASILRRYQPEELQEQREKIFACYIRKGYSYSALRQCLNDVLFSVDSVLN